MIDTEKNEVSSFCTVKRLLDYAEGYARAHTYGTSNDRQAARQVLEAELTRLLGDSKANSVLSTPLNQCDGCMSGQPMRGPLHIDSDGKALMVCQKSKYGIGGES